jgi:hypothetical protein
MNTTTWLSFDCKAHCGHLSLSAVCSILLESVPGPEYPQKLYILGTRNNIFILSVGQHVLSYYGTAGRACPTGAGRTERRGAP